MTPSTSMGYGSTTSGSIPSTPIMATHSTTEQVTLPLGPGTLTKNLGMPLLVVCCKVRNILCIGGFVYRERNDMVSTEKPPHWRNSA